MIQRDDDDDDDDWLVSLPPYPVNRGLTSAKAPLWPPERLIYLFTTTSMQCTTACALNIMHMIYAIHWIYCIVQCQVSHEVLTQSIRGASAADGLCTVLDNTMHQNLNCTAFDLKTMTQCTVDNALYIVR